MSLHNLTPAAGATRNSKRIGRGQGSGHGGTSTRGHKGAKSRSGAKFRAWFEGGQMPIQRRLPKFGFKNFNRVEFNPINLSRLAQLLELGKISADTAITPDLFVSLGLASKNDRIKILGEGELTVAFNIHAHGFSGSALQKIEAAGGTATVITRSKAEADSEG
jgi:large subunit ribosomal protein L15